MISNHQLQQDYTKLRPIAIKGDSFNANHVWYKTFTAEGFAESGPAVILFVLFWIYLAYLIFRDPIYDCLKGCCKGLFMEEF